MRGKLTIILAVLEATVLLVMKACDWKESKNQRPTAGKVKKAGGHRVVNPCPPEYDEDFTPGDVHDAAYLPAGGSAADEKIHPED